MRHRLTGVAALVAAAGTLALAQKVIGPEQFDQAMKTIGLALEGAEEAVEAGSFIEAKTPLALARQVLASTRPEWETLGRPDAVRMNREAVAALDALDVALSTRAVDEIATAAALADVNRTCDACHAVHRAGDEESGYRIGPAPR